MGERVKMLDRVWLATPDRVKRQAAVQEISGAVMAFFGGRASEACRALDRARAALEGRAPSIIDAVDLRPVKAVFEPGEKVVLRQGWAYKIEGDAPTLQIGELRIPLEAEKSRDIEIDLPALDKPAPEIDQPIEVRIGTVTRTISVPIVSDFERRLAKLVRSESRMARDLVAGIEAARSPNAETAAPIAAMLRQAEDLDAGRLSPEDVEEVRYARQGSTVLRALIPRGVPKRATVVIALHGAGGSENLFFEGYGGGLAVSEANKRGWVLLSPRATGDGAKNALAWLKEVRGIEPERLFVMGHSMGGGLTLASGPLQPKAIALFAPAARAIPADLAEVPMFLAVGKQEMAMLRTGAQSMSEAVKKAGEFREYDPCEHLMIVADALPDAFKFFDSKSK